MVVYDWDKKDVGLAWSAGERVGINSKQLDERLSNWMEELVRKEDGHDLPMAAAMVARKGKVVFYKGCGEAKPGKGIESDSLYRIYSMTKPITSLALMMLWEEGKFMLEDPVYLYLGDSWRKENLTVLEGHGQEAKPCKNQIRVRHLLTHCSGLTYGFFGLEAINPVDGIYQKSNKKVAKSNETLEEMVERLASLPLSHQPGEKWNYSYATDVVGRLVEVISGESLETFLKTRVFDPLHMFDTKFSLSEDELDRFVNIHLNHPSGQKMDVTQIQKKHKDYHPEKRMLSGGGGLVSTMRDYARFCQFCLNKGELEGKRLIGRKTFEFMTRNHLPNNKDLAQMTTESSAYMAPPGIGFGLGFAVALDSNLNGLIMSEGSFYWGGAASTIMWIDPREQLFAMFFTQLLNNDDLKLPLRHKFSNLVYGTIIDNPTMDSKL